MTTKNRIERLQRSGYMVKVHPNKTLKIELTDYAGHTYKFKNAYKAHIWSFGY